MRVELYKLLAVTKLTVDEDNVGILVVNRLLVEDDEDNDEDEDNELDWSWCWLLLLPMKQGFVQDWSSSSEILREAIKSLISLTMSS